jgi:hypothetical protein
VIGAVEFTHPQRGGSGYAVAIDAPPVPKHARLPGPRRRPQEHLAHRAGVDRPDGWIREHLTIGGGHALGELDRNRLRVLGGLTRKAAQQRPHQPGRVAPEEEHAPHRLPHVVQASTLLQGRESADKRQARHAVAPRASERHRVGGAARLRDDPKPCEADPVDQRDQIAGHRLERPVRRRSRTAEAGAVGDQQLDSESLGGWPHSAPHPA